MIMPLFSRLFQGVPDDPFYQPRKPLWLPEDMSQPPALEEAAPAGPVRRRFALLINPFYPKSPHGSFGKHVLTPTLALTSIAGATPPGWELRYWDENLLQGPPPAGPVPEVVGITVHLTFAARAYSLARWYRKRGSKVVMGGLHVQSCPEEVAPHADALAMGDGVQLWPRILRDVGAGRLEPRYRAGFDGSYEADPPPRRDLLGRGSYLTTASLVASRGCHNRCSFCYLSTRGLHMPYRVRDVEDIRRQIAEGGEPVRGIHRQQSRRKAGLPARPVPRVAAAGHHLEFGRDPRCDGRPRACPGNGAGRMHRRFHRF